MEKHPLHLKNPELQTSPGVQRAVVRKERQTKERVPNDPTARIDAYAARLEDVFLNSDARVRERNIDLFCEKIYDAFIIKRENFPESHFDLQKRIARERGQAVEEIPANVREQMIDVAIKDQKASLDAWIDYLASDDAVYPAWFKYFVWKNITKLSQFDKTRGEFKKRTDSTVAPFPDIYREPLAQIADIYVKVKEDNTTLKDAEVRDAFSKKFPVLYAELIQKSLAASLENRDEIRGQWVKYGQGEKGAADKLYASLENKGTGWCTAGQQTAKTQIESGDFYVYYTNDASGTPTQPRLAIRMDGTNRIAEVRGAQPHQSVEPIMQNTLDEKLAEFGAEADAYRKKSADMQRLTVLDAKHTQGDVFTKDDLLFLYEIDTPIEGFGYPVNGKCSDPRVKEIRGVRNTESDILVIFACERRQIARAISEIAPDTKAYIGKLEPGIFNKLPESVEHIYTSFPEGRIRREHIEIGGRTKKELLELFDRSGFRISDSARSMVESKEFTTLKNREEAALVRLRVADLGFANGATTQEIFDRALAFGLELCPPEVGPYYRLQYKDQPMNEWVLMGMQQISVDGVARVFHVGRDGGGSWLNNKGWVGPTGRWRADREFVFRLRKKT